MNGQLGSDVGASWGWRVGVKYTWRNGRRHRTRRTTVIIASEGSARARAPGGGPAPRGVRCRQGDTRQAADWPGPPASSTGLLTPRTLHTT
jgi:hypothetical protein